VALWDLVIVAHRISACSRNQYFQAGSCIRITRKRGVDLMHGTKKQMFSRCRKQGITHGQRKPSRAIGRTKTQNSEEASRCPCNMINIIVANITDAAALIPSSGKLVSMS
jgi:hypothetical protein